MVALWSCVTLLVFVHATIAVRGSVTLPQPHESSRGFLDGLFAPLLTIKSWGQYSPAYPVQVYHQPPKECKITQVNILKRHGARFPTAGATKRILSGVDKLKSATSYTDPRLQFLKQFAYDLGTDVLVPFGALQSFIAGSSTFIRYAHLVGPANLPFVRASDSPRVIDSANNWTAGFSLASLHHLNPKLSVIISEEPTANNTLDDSGCPMAGDSDEHVNAWVDIYATPIAQRLNSHALGMTANLTATDVHNLISLCPFHSIAKEKLSQFCQMFEPQEFAGFEWGLNLDKYYGTGYGQPIGGRVQGVGYVNELIARLTNTPVRDNTQTNRTLTSNPVTFPFNRSMYADFSHDNQMIAIYAAMGLLNEQHEVLSTTKINPKTEWDTSNMVPFSSELVVERLSCAWSSARGKAEDNVRILIEDAVQPLSFCGGDKDGLCKLSKFVESQSYARNDGEGDFARCFAA